MVNKIITSVSILFMGCLVQAQTVGEVLKKITAGYSIAQPLQYKTDYKLFKDHKSTKVEENYKGVFYKNAANEVYIKINDTEIINTKKTNIKVSHSENAIVVSNPVDNYFGEADFNKVFELCKLISFKDFKTYWEIILEPKAYSGLTYSKIVLNVSKTYFIQKQIFYYNTGINFSKEYKGTDINYPRLEVVHSDYSRKAIPPSVFNTQNYLSFSGKNSIVLAQRFKKYEIIDQRIISNNIK
jgi:hypothetical protein